MKKYIIILFIIMGGAIAGLWYLLQNEKVETKRLSSNQSALLTDVRHYKTKDSLSAASVERLQLTVGEFKRYYADQAEIISSLKIKLKRATSVTSTGIKTEYNVKIPVKENVVFHPPDSSYKLKCLDFDNGYLSVSGCFDTTMMFTGKIISRDTLEMVAHRVPKKFWFIYYGTKGISLDVVSRNPYSTIEYARYIDLK
jgi:hypothetical protein